MKLAHKAKRSDVYDVIERLIALGEALFKTTEEAALGKGIGAHRILILFGRIFVMTELHRDAAPAKNLCLCGVSVWIVFLATLAHMEVLHRVVEALGA